MKLNHNSALQDKENSKLIEQTIDAYNHIATAYSDSWFNLPPTSLLDKFIYLIKKDDLVMDAACGPGRDTKYFMDHDIKALGIDMSSNMLAEATTRVPEGDFVQMDVRHLAFPKEYFGGVWACAVLVHIPPDEIKTTLRSFNRVLKKGGILFLAFHEVENSKPLNERISEDGRYFVAYSENKMKEELLYSGFSEIITQRQVSYKSTYGDVANAIHWLNIWSQKRT